MENFPFNLQEALPLPRETQLLNLETYILRVHVDCLGCRKKVKKALTKIEGVYSVSIEAEEQIVTVKGNLDPARLVKKLMKIGKHAELLSPMSNLFRIEDLDHLRSNRRQKLRRPNPSLEASMFPSVRGGEDGTQWWLQRYKNQLNGEEDWCSETDLSQLEEDWGVQGDDHSRQMFRNYDDGYAGLAASYRVQSSKEFPGIWQQHYTPSSSPMMPHLSKYQWDNSHGRWMRNDPCSSFRNTNNMIYNNNTCPVFPTNNRISDDYLHQIYPTGGEQNMFHPRPTSNIDF